MIASQEIMVFFGTAGGIWALGFGWGKCAAWLRELKNAA